MALFVVVITGFALFTTILFYFVPANSVQSNSALFVKNTNTFPTQQETTPLADNVTFGLPMRLKIPKIDVDSTVEYVGLTSDGAMDVPKERANVGWLNLGPRPGENGSAVIDGHYGGKAAVFDNLYKLRKGDKLYVEDNKGVTISFVVRENRRYNPKLIKTDATYIFGSTDGKSHLNLITCEGAWDDKAQQYSERLVVFADKETE